MTADPWEAARAHLAQARAGRRGRAGAAAMRARQLRAVMGSPLLDHRWYAERHGLAGGPGLRLRAALDHLGEGSEVGRDPGPGFSTRFYYAANPDVARSGWAALAHYEARGRAERRPIHPAGPPGLPFEEAVIAASPLFDAAWYAREHADVAASGLAPAEHYRTRGAARGLAPGPRFDPRRHGIVTGGLTPLVASLLDGGAPGGEGWARQIVGEARDALLSLGFTDAPLADLETLAAPDEHPDLRALAAEELARWHLRAGDAEAALGWAERALAAAEGPGAQRLAVLRLAALARLGRGPEEAPPGSPGAIRLAAAMTAPDETRLESVSEALRGWSLPGLTARAEPLGPGLYGRLRSEAVPAVPDGPLISVIVAAHDAEATLPLTLAALAEQSWRRHEVIVVDDASTDGTRVVAEAHAARDDRVRVIALDENVGAYAARNRALREARGRYVTLQDADDWSGATRLEVQAHHLAAHPDVIACTAQHARVSEDLRPARFSVAGELVFASPASLMLRRKPVVARLGGWDEVRFGADSEMMRRIRRAFGEAALAHLPTGPVTLQRHAAGSATADPDTGFDGAFHGARLEYAEAQRHHHARGGRMLYRPGDRPFPVPAVMRPGAERHHRLDVVMASEWRMKGGSVRSGLQEIDAQRAAGLTTGLVKMYRYDLRMRGGLDTFEDVRDRVDGRAVRVLARGERATCDLLILRYPPVLQHRLRGLPEVDARRVKVIVNQPPRSSYADGGEVRYEIPRAEENLRAAFGRPGEWHPIGPLIRDALHERHAEDLAAIDLRPDDWINVIDVDEWDRRRRRRRRGPLRIGRHARDAAVKWPDGAEAILEVYPDAPDVEVHVLGGAATAVAQIGRTPRNWHVRPFGAMEPRAFLGEIDVFAYYTHPGWVESFGRSIVEAMAAGVPAVLPPRYARVFGPDAATYAPPEHALAAARALHAEPARAAAQAREARAIVRARFGHDRHLARLREAGVGA